MSDKFLKSTVIIGDSNTRFLKFGTGQGTFGQNIPGKRIEALHINKINPLDCCGFQNIFIHCGVNDIKSYTINSRDKLSSKFTELKGIIDQILILCPTSKVYVSPILPTKSRDINLRASQFNELLLNFRGNMMHYKFDTLNFNEFVNNSGYLHEDYGRYWNPEDQLHLGSKGIRVLVGMIRERVYCSTISHSRAYRDYGAVLRGDGVSRAGRGHGVAMFSHLDIGAP